MTWESCSVHPEALDQVEGVVGGEARRIGVLRKQQQDQDRHRQQDATARRRRHGRPPRAGCRRRPPGPAEAPHSAKPSRTSAPSRRARPRRTRRGSPVRAARRRPQRAAGRWHSRHGRRPGRRPGRGPAGPPQHAAPSASLPDGTRPSPARPARPRPGPSRSCGEGEREQAEQRRAHARHHRIGPGLAVGDIAEQRLEQRRGDLEGERDQADLHEIEAIGVLDQRIHRRDHRLDQVVEQMRAAQCRQNGHERAVRRGGGQRDRRHAATLEPSKPQGQSAQGARSA